MLISWDKAVSYEANVDPGANMKYSSKVGDTTETSIKDCDRGKNVKMYYQVVAVSSTNNKSSSKVESIWL